MFSLEETGLFNELKFVLREFIDEALEERLYSFFLVAENEKVVFAFVTEMLELYQDHLAADPDRVEIFNDEVLVVYPV